MEQKLQPQAQAMKSATILRKHKNFRVRSASKGSLLQAFNNKQKQNSKINKTSLANDDHVQRYHSVRTLKRKGTYNDGECLFKQQKADKKVPPRQYRQKSESVDQNIHNGIPNKKNSLSIKNSKHQHRFYHSVKTQGTSLDQKKCIDVNSVYTGQQDIQQLNRIANLCDPFKILQDYCNQENDEHENINKLNKRSTTDAFRSKQNTAGVDYTRLKSSSSARRKRSTKKLTDKINNLVFNIQSAKSLYKNKNSQMIKTPRKERKEKKELKDTSIQREKNNYKKTQMMKRSSGSQRQKRLKEGQSSKRMKKREKLFQCNNIQVSKELKALRQKKKKKDTDSRHYRDKYLYSKPKNIDPFWQQINESLIIAAQEQYASIELADFVRNNMY